jgi:hypothetical protein
MSLSAVIQQPETDSGVILTGAGNLFTLQLDAEKTGEEVNRHPPKFPIPIGVPWLVSQAIFEQSLGSSFALLTPQPIDVFLSNQLVNSWRASGCQTKRRCENFERGNPYKVLE